MAAAPARPTAAARLLGAAEALFAAAGTRLSPAQRADHERAGNLARAALGEERFAAAWAAGSAMCLDAVVVEALALESGPA